MEQLIAELMKMFPLMNAYLAGGIFIFARLLGFFRLAPVFNRKEIPGMVKLSLCLLMTIILTCAVKPDVTRMKPQRISRMCKHRQFCG